MTDPRIKKLADLLVNYSVKVQPDEWVLINGHMVAEPLIAEVLRAVLEAGGRPQIVMSSDAIAEYSLKYANDEQIKWIAPTIKMLYEEADVLIALQAYSNTRNMSGVDPKKQQLSRPGPPGSYANLHEALSRRFVKMDLDQFPLPGFCPGRRYEPGRI